MRASKNDRGFMETMTGGKPYRLWATDEYECPKCGYKVLTGFGIECIVEHFEPNFQLWLDKYKDNLITEENP